MFFPMHFGPLSMQPLAFVLQTARVQCAINCGVAGQIAVMHVLHTFKGWRGSADYEWTT